jgi:uncharacterized protein (DUF433 family)
VRGLRIRVADIQRDAGDVLAQGVVAEQILADFADLPPEDFRSRPV